MTENLNMSGKYVYKKADVVRHIKVSLDQLYFRGGLYKNIISAFFRKYYSVRRFLLIFQPISVLSDIFLILFVLFKQLNVDAEIVLLKLVKIHQYYCLTIPSTIL